MRDAGSKPSSVSRRAFLRGSGGVLAGLSAVAVGWPEAVARALASDAGLSASSRATLRHLIDTLAEAPGSPVRREDADLAVGELERSYLRQSNEFRARVDAVLDVIERAPGGAGLSAKTTEETRDFLWTWLGARSEAERALERQIQAWGEGQPRASGGNEAFKEFVRGRAEALQANSDAIRRAEGDAALELDPRTGLSPYEPPPAGESFGSIRLRPTARHPAGAWSPARR